MKKLGCLPLAATVQTPTGGEESEEPKEAFCHQCQDSRINTLQNSVGNLMMTVRIKPDQVIGALPSLCSLKRESQQHLFAS